LLDPILGKRAKESQMGGSPMINTKRKPIVNYRFMIVFNIIVGVISIVILLIPDFELLTFIMTTGALGGLIGGSRGYEERDRQQLEKSYKTVFEWLFLITLAAYAFLALSRSFVFLEGMNAFLNNRWPGLIISLMCILMGIVGFQKRIREDSV
jgi:hypothetical protein